MLAVAAALAAKQKHRKGRLRWTKEWILKRCALGHSNLLKELRLVPGDWHNYLRMNEETYFKLLKLVTPLIKTCDLHKFTAIDQSP